MAHLAVSLRQPYLLESEEFFPSPFLTLKDTCSLGIGVEKYHGFGSCADVRQSLCSSHASPHVASMLHEMALQPPLPSTNNTIRITSLSKEEVNVACTRLVDDGFKKVLNTSAFCVALHA